MDWKIRIKRSLSAALSGSGLCHLFERWRLSQNAFVLVYHRVLEAKAGHPHLVQPGMYVTTASLERQIIFLRERFQLVFLEELVARIMAGKAIGGLCALTFDDGWRDNFTQAFPLLVKHHVPATIFLATGFIGTSRSFWPDELCYYLTQSARMDSAFLDAPPALRRLTDEISALDGQARLERAIDTMKGCRPREREEILTQLRCRFGQKTAVPEIMDWDQAREMLASGLVRYGSHTVTHELLDQVPLQRAQDQIVRSRQMIEAQLGCEVSLFSYPNGNFNPGIQQLLRKCGYNAAATMHKGVVDAGVELTEIPRISMHEDASGTIPLFRSRISFHFF